jgi:protein disulfide-isomerase A6
MKPILEKVAQTFKPESNCIIVNMDADAAQNKGIAKEYSVNSYPTLKFFPRSDSPYARTPLADDKVSQEVYAKYQKHAIVYEKARTEEAFVAFLNEHCGTHRAVGGGLDSVAGRLGETWDAWAADIVGFAGAAKEGAKERMAEVVQMMKAGAAEVKKEEEWAANWYARVGEKLVNGTGTTEWIEKETKRSVSSPTVTFRDVDLFSQTHFHPQQEDACTGEARGASEEGQHSCCVCRKEGRAVFGRDKGQDGGR